MDPEQMDSTLVMLAKACEASGGTITVSEAEIEDMKARYGLPTPLIMGRDEQGLFAVLLQVSDVAEQGWPWLARSMHLSEPLARAAAKALQAQLELVQVRVVEAEEAARVRKLDGMN